MNCSPVTESKPHEPVKKMARQSSTLSVLLAQLHGSTDDVFQSVNKILSIFSISVVTCDKRFKISHTVYMYIKKPSLASW